MDNNYRILEWDSDFFGYKIASLRPLNLGSTQLNEIISVLQRNDFTLAYCFVNPGDHLSNCSLKESSGFLADEKITFIVDLTEMKNKVYSEYIEPYRLNTSSDKLRVLALQSGYYSRFRIDPKFHNNEYEKLYREWIDKSVSKLMSDEILVYYKDDDEKGFVTLGIKNGVGSIGLIAVDELERGNSIGKELMSAALSFFLNKNICSVEVVTQKANKVACEFYKSRGFSFKSIENVYHLWIK
jgi:dTDP-4-amino-4,6-dideoxy-D-galactose acyltransferase